MISWPYIAFPILFCLLGIRKYKEYTWGFYKNKTSLKGKVFLITGGNSGVGKDAACQLAARQATVIIASRNEKLMQEAITDIRNFTKEGELIYYKLDLGCLDSIRKFAVTVLEKHPRIDVLINNAGVSVPLQNAGRTVDGFEMNMGVNHLGHFLLTHLLLPRVIESAPSRIVIVSSTLFERASLDLNDLEGEKLRALGKKYAVSPTYWNSKLANVYHGRELSVLLEDSKVDVRILSPGLTYTNLGRYTTFKWWQYFFIAPVFFFIMRSSWQGSQTIVYCATENNLPGKSGDFYANCKLYHPKMKFNDELQKQLWAKSCELVRINSL